MYDISKCPWVRCRIALRSDALQSKASTFEGNLGHPWDFKGISQGEVCCNVGYSDAISGLVSHYDERHKQRIIIEHNQYACISNKIMEMPELLDIKLKTKYTNQNYYINKCLI